jgi:hypothetical protein
MTDVSEAPLYFESVPRLCQSIQKGAKDNGQVRFFPCGYKLDPDIIGLLIEGVSYLLGISSAPV